MNITTFQHKPIGWWEKKQSDPESGATSIGDAVLNLIKPVYIVNKNSEFSVAQDGTAHIGPTTANEKEAYPLLAYAPPLHPENLGDPLFKKRYGLQFAYIVGAMANGITSAEMVEAAARTGILAFFGTGGLPIPEIEKAIVYLQGQLNGLPFGMNLIHSHNSPEFEMATVCLYLKHGIRLISASAYLDLTLPLVYFRVKGIHRSAEGQIISPNRIIAKVSRIEVARKFLSPPPEKLVSQLVDKKLITREEAALSEFIPMADDITAEADSGGHTDNRPAITLLPTMLALRDEITRRHPYTQPVHVGMAGGIATPESAAAAFALGAAFILTGSVNQSCREAGTSDTVKKMLGEAKQADVTMAPSGDMFEMGAKVQVLKRGTMFPMRASKLYELYNSHNAFENIPEDQKDFIENKLLLTSFQEEWEQTKKYFLALDPRQIELGENNPKHKMALVFRSYLGRASVWAQSGDLSRVLDYQIWCGPAMGAFNEWVKGSFLEDYKNRGISAIALNLLYGASIITRMGWLRAQGIHLPPGTEHFTPMQEAALWERLKDNIS